MSLNTSKLGLEHEFSLFDPFAIFSPKQSQASHILEIQSITHGERLAEYLVKHGVSIDLLDTQPHGGQLLKLTQNEHVAYARTTNVSLDNHQRFMANGERPELPEHPIWHIDIAFIGNTQGMFTNVLNAVLAMNSLYQAKCIQSVKVNPYQALDSLCEHTHSLALPGNEKLTSIAFHGKELEITTEHKYTDSNIRYTRVNTLWFSDEGLICSEAKGINEDWTVSTHDVPLSYLELPYSENKLSSIAVQKCSVNNTPLPALLLTIVPIDDSEKNGEQTQFSIDLSASPIAVTKVNDKTNETMSLAQYRKQHCYTFYELQGVIDELICKRKAHLELLSRQGDTMPNETDGLVKVCRKLFEKFMKNHPEYEAYREDLWLPLIEDV